MRATTAILLSKPTRPPASIMAQFANSEKGCILVPSLQKYVWQDTAKTIPASIGGAVAKIVCPATGVEATFSNATLQIDSEGKRYVNFNGTSSSGATGAIDFSGTDKLTVSIGAYKGSDVASGVLLELTASYSANNGTFGLFAPGNSGVGNYSWASRGTASAIATAATYTAPIKNVITGIGNIAGDSSIIRVNGAQIDSVATDQGTGNYSNAAIYIGARNSGSIFFTGRFYGMVARGAASSAGQIADVERYLAGLTGVNF